MEPLPRGVHTGISIARFSTNAASVSETRYAAGHRALEHEHESAFITATLAGQSKHLVTGAREHDLFTPGNVAFFPHGVPHCHTAQTAGCHSVIIDIHPGYESELIELGADLSRPFDIFDASIFRLFPQLRNEIRDPDPLSRLQIDALIGEACVLLTRLRRRNESSTIPLWMKRVVREIDERYREQLVLEDLAAVGSVHPVHVSRAFRRYYGETVRDYIRRLRIREARRLLEDGSRSALEIATEVGYYDESHFLKAFRKVVGISPAQYRLAVQA